MGDQPSQISWQLTAEEEQHLRVLETARREAGGLLTDAERARMTHVVDQFEKASAEHEAWAHRWEAARRATEESAPRQDVSPADQIRSLWSVQRGEPPNPSGQRHAALSARKALAADDARRRPLEELLQQARESRVALETAFEARVRRGVAEGVLPMWFTVALGSRPGSGGNAEKWLRSGVRLLWFRALHQVTDELLPCGKLEHLDSSGVERATSLLLECDQVRN